MELLLNSFITHQILEPVFPSGFRNNSLKIKHIGIFERGKEFGSKLKNNMLIFFPEDISFREVDGLHLEERDCSAVFYKNSMALREMEEVHFPVLQIREKKLLSEAVEECYELFSRDRESLAQISLETMEILSSELVKNHEEEKSIIKIASKLLHCPVTFSTPDFQRSPSQLKEYLVVVPLCGETGFDWDQALENFSLDKASFHPALAKAPGGERLAGYRYYPKCLDDRGLQILIFPVSDESYLYGYLYMTQDMKEQKLSMEQVVKLRQILALLKFEIIKSNEIARTVNRYYDFLLDELIESDRTDFRKLMEKYGLIQKPIYDQYFVLIVGRSPQEISDSPFHDLMTSQFFNTMYDKLVKSIGTINFFVFERKDYIVTLIPKELAGKDNGALYAAVSTYREFLAEQYQGIGISDVVDTEKIRQGYLQALKALAVSRHSRDKSPCYYGELGVLRFFFDNSNKLDFAPLMQVYEEYIKPIAEYDSQHGGELLSTLTAYITYRCSPSASCQALFIHKNTLYSRLDKISQLLGKSLSDSEIIFNISFGLKIQTLLETGIIQKTFDM